MRLKKPSLILILFFSLFILTTCGFDVYYYLPQLDEPQQGESTVSIVLPGLGSDFFYATGYTIFYKIYLSNTQVVGTILTPDQMRSINQQIQTDYDNFFSFIDSTNTNVPTASTFRNRNYFELSFEEDNILSINPARTLSITFHAIDPATVSINGTQRGKILRNRELDQISPNHDFLSTDELRINTDAGAASSDATNNLDVYPVSSGAQGSATFAYVSMYIVITGINQSNFNNIFSKPTHLGVFRLMP